MPSVYFDIRKAGSGRLPSLTAPRRQVQYVSHIDVIFAMRNITGGPLKIGRQQQRSSAICTSNQDTILVRGHDLAGELIGSIGFTEYFWLLLTGALPSAIQRRVLDATLVAIAEHGLVPSVQAARMTLAAAPEALQGAVAAGILGCGSVVLGSSEAAGQLFTQIAAAVAGGAELDAAATRIVAEYRAAGRAIPGYGHPLHKRADPRAQRLFQVAAKAGSPSTHAGIAHAVERLLPQLIGRPLALNVSGAIPAVLLDVGYPAAALKGVPILARAASLIAHLLEERTRPIGFVLSHAAAQAIDYDGVAPAGFKASDDE
jgi:citrate synthase